MAKDLSAQEGTPLEGYVKKELRKGFPIKLIKKALLKAGHEKEVVEDAIKAAGYKKRISLNKKLVLVTTLVLLLALAFSIYILRTPEAVPELPEPAEEVTVSQVVYNDEDVICIALAKEDNSECEKYGLVPTDEKECFDRINFYEGVLDKDIDSCDRISDIRNPICKAIVTGDQSICDSIDKTEFGTLQDIKLFCKGLALDDESYCSKMSEEQDECFAYINIFRIIGEKNINLCDSLSHSIEICKATISHNAAICAE